MGQNAKEILEQLYGKKCCRARVVRPRSLSIGFGEPRFHGDASLDDDYYGEWEVGTYYGAWRIIQRDRIICSSGDLVDVEGLNQAIKGLEFGRLLELEVYRRFDVRLSFDSGLTVDFIATSSSDDELFHVFCHDNLYIELAPDGTWIIGKSNEPWQRP